jgi:hypothetical protein
MVSKSDHFLEIDVIAHVSRLARGFSLFGTHSTAKWSMSQISVNNDVRRPDNHVTFPQKIADTAFQI